MALFNKQNQSSEEATNNGKQKPALGPEAHNHIGQGTHLTGDLQAPGLLRVDGSIKGNVTCEAKAVFGTKSAMEGTLIANTAEIAGKISGRVEVKELLVVKPTGILEGETYYGKLVVENGGTVTGTIDLFANKGEVENTNSAHVKTTEKETPTAQQSK